MVIESFFSQVEKGKKELRKRSAEVRGALVELKDKAARPGTKLKVQRVLAHILILLGSNRTADCRGVTDVRAFLL